MKSVKLFFLFLSIIILNNCSHHHEVKVDAVASPDQMIDYEGVVTSEMKNVVSLAYYDKLKKMLNNKATFIIIVENYEDKPIDFSTDNISVMFEGDSIDWSLKKIELETPIDVMKDTQKNIMGRNIMIRRGEGSQGFGGVLPNRDAASSLSSLTGGGSFTPRQSTINSSDARQMRLNNINTFKAQSFYMLPRMLIKPKIIMPNENMSGIFVCDTSKMKSTVKGNFLISVRVGDEEHKFIFSRS